MKFVIKVSRQKQVTAAVRDFPLINKYVSVAPQYKHEYITPQEKL